MLDLWIGLQCILSLVAFYWSLANCYTCVEMWEQLLTTMLIVMMMIIILLVTALAQYGTRCPKYNGDTILDLSYF
jgi:hypothetical protein